MSSQLSPGALTEAMPQAVHPGTPTRGQRLPLILGPAATPVRAESKVRARVDPNDPDLVIAKARPSADV